MPKTKRQNKSAGGSHVETQALLSFSALDDWFEIARCGTHTAKNGEEVEFNEAMLDSIVNNMSESDPAPFVIGHPKENGPAYGWTSSLKREGKSLYAKADETVEEFAEWVDKKLYRKRSVSIVPDGDGGYQLRHIGFLGATPPAIKGMEDLQYSAGDDQIELEFSETDAIREVSWYFSGMHRMFRGFREYLIEKEGVEEADKIIPSYTLDNLAAAGEAIRAQLENDDNPLFSAPEEVSMPPVKKKGGEPTELSAAQSRIEQLEQELEDQKKANEEKDREAAFASRKTRAEALIETKIKDNSLLPKDVPGLAEFLASQSDEQEATFEFSVGDGDKAATKKQTPFEFCMSFVKGLSPQIKTGRMNEEGPDDFSAEFSSHHGAVDQDRAKLDRQALEYSRKNDVSYEEAVIAIQENV